MSPEKKPRDRMRDDFAAVFSPARLARLEARGLDIAEGKREGAYVWDTAGKKYLDCHGGAGIFNLGRRPPEVVAALRAGLRATDQGNFPMISKEKAALASSLAEFIGGGFECSVFGVVRGEAFDFACKLGRGYTGRPELLAIDGCWFGETGFALSLSTRTDKKAYTPLVPRAAILPFGEIAAVQQAVTDAAAAVFVEPVQAENHCRVLPDDYLRALRDRCREVGALLVFDETQTGFGRTGKRFAFEHTTVEPDVLILGEALGAGVFPIVATVFSQQINTFMNRNPLIHLSTFGGSDVGCVTARGALDAYRDKRPWVNAARLEAPVRDELDRARAQHKKLIKSVAGRGLLFSLELADAQKADAFCRNLVKAGVLATTGRVATNTVVLRPSLLLDDDDVARLALGVNDAARAMI